ncbi:MAG: nicotinic acid mononucleotide adenylyltransferase [Cytophagaceae bacterium]|nr:nicotinic acid mononucleotide adenylyltransferase [Cytophagaceae bacterium]|tara:strand:- start:12750 stop:13328 length:579 start_codon:yes stop_codon:yes gene_type:complete
MKIGLYFGTFNPIHVGHLIIANHMVEFCDLDKIWVVITPHNPFKKKKTLLDNHHRYQLVQRVLEDYPKLEASTIEFELPQPNYTVDTLAYLQEKYPQQEFALIMGEDNLKSLHKWKNHEVIMDHHEIYVYPRVSEGAIEHRFKDHPKVKYVKAPIIEISATAIRNAIREGKNVKPLLTEEAWNYIDEMNFYK